MKITQNVSFSYYINSKRRTIFFGFFKLRSQCWVKCDLWGDFKTLCWYEKWRLVQSSQSQRYIFHYISFGTNDAMTDGLFRLNDFLHAFDNCVLIIHSEKKQKRLSSITHGFKITQNVAFYLIHFSIFHHKLFDRKLQVFRNSLNWHF